MNMMSKSVLLFIFCLFISVSSSAQSCFNIGFEDSSIVSWVPFFGTYQDTDGFTPPPPNPVYLVTPGVEATGHVITSGFEYDPQSDSLVTTVAPGSEHSLRLGNSSAGRKTEWIQYTTTVDSSNLILVYGVAVLLNNPPTGHEDQEKPGLFVQILDSTGAILDSNCGVVSYIAGVGLPGFVDQQANSNIKIRPWDFAGIDLLPYIGQQITVDFRTRDCSQGAHFGYGYIDAGCFPREIKVDYCLGQSDTITFTAPLGFSYLWSNGDTNQSFSVLADSADPIYTCTLTSTLTGCSFSLDAVTEPTFYSNFDLTETSCGEATIRPQLDINRGSIANYFWDFGDSTTLADTSNLVQPTYTYPQPGKYTVILIADDGLGCSSDTLIDTVNIYFPPVANFLADTVCLTDSTTFTNLSTFSANVGTFFDWTFGDGGIDTSFAPQHLYGSDSLKTVQLIVWSDSLQCGDTISKLIQVYPRPNVSFFKIEPDSCTPHEVNFINTSTADSIYPISSYQWSFGNLDSSNVANPTYVYQDAGLYTVYLSAIDVNGCIDSSTFIDYIQVYPIPTADFTVSDSSVYITEAEVLFENQSNNADTYQWVFGSKSNANAGTSIETNPSWTFTRSGAYRVNLLAVSNFGCFDTAFKTINVIDDRTFLPNVITPNGDGFNDAFVLKVDLNSISAFKIQIFNRWGAQVYQASSAGFSWDGTVNGEELPSGIYYYDIEYVGFEDNDFAIRGSVQLLR